MAKRPTLSTHLKRILVGWRPARRPGDREPAFAALYIAGPAEAVSKRIGDNRGCRPIRLGVTGAWQDEITKRLEWAAPLYWQGVLFRVWCPNLTRAKLLESLVLLELPSDPLRKSWIDLGPDLDIKAMEKAVRKIASDNNIPTWSDQEMVKHLEKVGNDLKEKIKRHA